MANYEEIRVIHGFGTGKLREGVQKYLKNHKFVKSIRNGIYGEGEHGVTVVTLKV
jgi:DNA mismatch repair protein MutS2